MSIFVHRVASCTACGKDISDTGSLEYERRQVYDIPPLQIKVTEHRLEIKCCPHCRARNRGCFPVAVSQPVQYGNHLKQLAVYLTQYQLIPYKLAAQLIEDITGHGISEGSLVNFNGSCNEQLPAFIDDLKTHLVKSPVMNVDETGCYFEGKRYWLHTATTKDATYYYPHEKRGKAAMDAMGILPDYKGVLMHDFWKNYLEYDCHHALCNVHHLRDLTFCEEQEKSNWAKTIKAFLVEIKTACDEACAKGLSVVSPFQIEQFIEQYDDLMEAGKLEHPPPLKEKGKRGTVKKTKSRNLLERFIAHKEDILRFAKDFSIPFGNNVAEQAIPMMKVKQKISGCFRSKEGAVVFANIRSYIDTMRKNGITIMDALASVINGEPFIPFPHTYPQYEMAE